MPDDLATYLDALAATSSRLITAAFLLLALSCVLAGVRVWSRR